MRCFGLLAISLLLTTYSSGIHAQSKGKVPVKTGSATVPEAQKAGVPTKIGAWELVRFVSGENAHFLYASQKRTFSLFVTETKNQNPLKPQVGWKTLRLTETLTAFAHKDPRNPECAAIVFKHLSQRRMILGKLTEDELIALAKQLR